MAEPTTYDDLPLTWPFRLAGTLFIIGMVWFTMGYTVAEDKASKFFPVFWTFMLATVVSVLLGIVINVVRSRQRRARLQASSVGHR